MRQLLQIATFFTKCVSALFHMHFNLVTSTYFTKLKIQSNILNSDNNKVFWRSVFCVLGGDPNFLTFMKMGQSITNATITEA